MGEQGRAGEGVQGQGGPLVDGRMSEVAIMVRLSWQGCRWHVQQMVPESLAPTVLVEALCCSLQERLPECWIREQHAAKPTRSRRALYYYHFDVSQCNMRRPY